MIGNELLEMGGTCLVLFFWHFFSARSRVFTFNFTSINWSCKLGVFPMAQQVPGTEDDPSDLDIRFTKKNGKYLFFGL